MNSIINGIKQIKQRVDSGTITTINGTETLLSKQLESLIEAAINYNQCCMELKDKEELTFDEWIKENNYRKVHKGYARNQIRFGDEEMLQRYNYYKRLL